MLTLARFPGLTLEYICVSCFFFLLVVFRAEGKSDCTNYLHHFFKKQTLTAFQPLKLVFVSLFRTLFAIVNC